jgi:DNA modification methylase
MRQNNPGLFDEPIRFGSSPVSSKPHRSKNLLNDLEPREWLKATKSVWYSNSATVESPEHAKIAEILRQNAGDTKTEMLLGQLLGSLILSRPGPRDALKSQHPATFAEQDIIRLIRFFTKAGDWVLDPFLGSGSTLVACKQAGRNGLGIEVTHKWVRIAEQRLYSTPSFLDEPVSVEVQEGDALSVLKELPNRRFSMVLTSPPYWGVLNKKADHKVKHERLRKGLATNYSNSKLDLGNVPTYEKFLSALKEILAECRRVLKPGGYAAFVVSDFRDKDKFYLFHADIARTLERAKFQLAGITILVQDAKTLYPYGMPHAFVSNIHHQYVVVARKPA